MGRGSPLRASRPVSAEASPLLCRRRHAIAIEPAVAVRIRGGSPNRIAVPFRKASGAVNHLNRSPTGARRVAATVASDIFRERLRAGWVGKD